MWNNLTEFLQHSFRNCARSRKLNLREKALNIQLLDARDNDFHRSIMYDFICGCFNVNGSRLSTKGVMS